MATKKKLFYGWIVVLGACIACGTMLYMTVNSISLFVAPVISELGVSATAFLVCTTLRSLGAVLFSPLGGKMLDTRGTRFTVVVFGLMMAAGYAVLAAAKSIYLFYVGYFIVGLGSGPIVSYSNAVCSRWFRKYRGLANGIVTSGNGLISFVISPVLASVIADSGYWCAYMLVAALLLVFGVGIALLLIRDDPRDMGLLPDGEAQCAAVSADKREALPGLTMKQIYKTGSFWLVGPSAWVRSISAPSASCRPGTLRFRAWGWMQSPLRLPLRFTALPAFPPS